MTVKKGKRTNAPNANSWVSIRHLRWDIFSCEDDFQIKKKPSHSNASLQTQLTVANWMCAFMYKHTKVVCVITRPLRPQQCCYCEANRHGRSLSNWRCNKTGTTYCSCIGSSPVCASVFVLERRPHGPKSLSNSVAREENNRYKSLWSCQAMRTVHSATQLLSMALCLWPEHSNNSIITSRFEQRQV